MPIECFLLARMDGGYPARLRVALLSEKGG
jgi:hypothetical protein